MRTPLYLTTILLLAATVIAADRREAKFSAKAERTASSMRKTILAEIKDLANHEWAGEYYAGDGLGVNTAVAIAPKSGYVFEWHGCLGLYDRNYGGVTWTNDRIRLAFTFDNKRQGFEGLAPEFIPIRWGTRHYLVPTGDIIGFCNNVNEGREPREDVHGFCLLRRGDEKAEVSGFPIVPKEYRSYLLAEPIEAAIESVSKYATRSSVCDWKFKDTPVTLNVGSKKGLRAGMELHVAEPGNIVESVRITKVEESRSEAVMTQIGEDATGPLVGWKLSTQAPWTRATKDKHTTRRSTE
jgi:hypothetical protein